MLAGVTKSERFHLEATWTAERGASSLALSARQLVGVKFIGINIRCNEEPVVLFLNTSFGQ